MEDKIKNFDENGYIVDIKPQEIYKYCEDIKVGDIVEGKVIEVANDGVYVDIFSKTDGFIPIDEFPNKNISEIFKPNQIIKVFVRKINYDDVHIVSYRKAKEVEIRELLEKNFNNRTPMDATLISKTEYGYIVDIGIDAVLPFKETTKELKEKIEKLKPNEKFNFKVIIKEIKDKNKELEIVVSNKIYEEIIRQQLKEKLLNTIKEGDEVIGEVKTITSFGAFVEINGVETLLHISDIAWHKIKDPQELLHQGDKIKVKILKIDKDTGKISVGLKQLFPHPWEEIEKKYHVGEVVKGKITNITKFGIFVELEPAIEGLVHISEVSWEDKMPDLQKIYKIGQEIQVKILNINKEERKLSLSIKKVFKNPWEDLKKEFPKGTKQKGKITKILPYGMFVLIKPGFEGLIHKSDISWTKRIDNLFKIYKVGQYVEYIVLDILPEQERAILSIKHLYPNPFEKYKVDDIVKCKIKKILRNILIVSLDKDVEGIITKKEAISEEKDISKELKALYKPGQEIDAVVTFVDENTYKIELSVKKLHKVIQKQLIKKYSKIETPTLKDILSES
jgi:small subunit ribosomal protein S1